MGYDYSSITINNRTLKSNDLGAYTQGPFASGSSFQAAQARSSAYFNGDAWMNTNSGRSVSQGETVYYAWKYTGSGVTAPYCVYVYASGTGYYHACYVTQATMEAIVPAYYENNASASAVARTYNGSSQTGVAGSYVSWSGTTSATNAGTYTAYATPTGYHRWSDTGGSEARSVTWTLSKASQTAPTATGASVYYGSTATATASGGGGIGTLTWTNGSTRTSVGTTSTAAYWSGDANHSASPNSNSVNLVVNRARTASYTSSNKTYNGSSQTAVTGTNVTLEGDTKATNAGSYTAYATPTSNYAWSDGGTSKKTITWTMQRSNTASVTTSDKTYNGSSQTGATSTTATISSGASGTNAGTYTAKATPTSNYAWSDGTYSEKSFTWTIKRLNTADASAMDVVRTGEEIIGVTGSHVIWSGTISAIDSGTYIATAIPESNYAWLDNTYAERIFEWNIIDDNKYVHIFEDGTWRKAIPYIYIDGTWRQSTPYIYVDGSWKITTN